MIGPRRLVQSAALLFLAAGLYGFGYVAYALDDARRFQREGRARLVVEARLPAPAARVRQPGDVLGEIRSDRIGLSAVIAEGDSDDVLRRAVGHVMDTPAPGEPGNIALAAHRDTFFRPLEDVRVGDIITITAGGRDVHYEVEWTKVVSPYDISVLDPTREPTLTLITCHPFGFIGNAPNRFIVRARARDARQP